MEHDHLFERRCRSWRKPKASLPVNGSTNRNKKILETHEEATRDVDHSELEAKIQAIMIPTESQATTKRGVCWPSRGANNGAWPEVTRDTDGHHCTRYDRQACKVNHEFTQLAHRSHSMGRISIIKLLSILLASILTCKKLIGESNSFLLIPQARQSTLSSTYSPLALNPYSHNSLTAFRQPHQTARQRRIIQPTEDRLSQMDIGSSGVADHQRGPNEGFSYEPIAPQAPRSSSIVGGKRMELLHQQLAELKRQFELELSSSLSDRQWALGSPCAKTADCAKTISGAHCKLETLTCECLSHHVAFNSTTCLPAALLGQECQIDAQCQRKVADSHCGPDGRCACTEGHLAFRKDKCLPAAKIGDYCLSNEQCQLYDRHASCSWKIIRIYGLCKCPPNYKLVDYQEFAATASKPEVGNQTLVAPGKRCAPRLGDACHETSECLMATPDSECRTLKAEEIIKGAWPTGTGSGRCSCASGYQESDSRLKCSPPTAPASRTTPASEIAGHQPTVEWQLQSPMDAKHQYELLPASTNTSVAPPVAPVPTSEVAPTSTETVSTTTASPLDDGARNVSMEAPAPKAGVQMAGSESGTLTSGVRPSPVGARQAVASASSLGKSCVSANECRRTDPHSDCVSGRCECRWPTAACSANSTGCHADTFQCRDGQCISWYFVCDRIRNCADGSDEDECRPGSCPQEAYQCPSDGACLSRSKVCDGRRDCTDGSDELHCGGPRFVASLVAVNQSATAGGGECHPRAFRCDNGQCLPGHVFCNAVEDCADGSDERDLICERLFTRPQRVPPTLAGAGGALGAGAHISVRRRPAPARRRPASSAAAPRGLGRRGRSAGECPRWAFTCRNGKCRSSAILCSGVDGCGDNSDEDRCQVCRCAPPPAS